MHDAIGKRLQDHTARRRRQTFEFRKRKTRNPPAFAHIPAIRTPAIRAATSLACDFRLQQGRCGRALPVPARPSARDESPATSASVARGRCQVICPRASPGLPDRARRRRSETRRRASGHTAPTVPQRRCPCPRTWCRAAAARREFAVFASMMSKYSSSLRSSARGRQI